MGYLLKAQSMGFADGSVIDIENKRVEDNYKILVLKNQKMEHARD